MKTTTRKLPSGLRGFCNDKNEWQCTGAAMGRRNNIPSDYGLVKKLHLVKLHMSPCGCYDEGGAYWGLGAPIYWAYGDSDSEQAEVFFRAKSRADAKRQALAAFPNAKFYN